MTKPQPLPGRGVRILSSAPLLLALALGPTLDRLPSRVKSLLRHTHEPPDERSSKAVTFGAPDPRSWAFAAVATCEEKQQHKSGKHTAGEGQRGRRGWDN